MADQMAGQEKRKIRKSFGQVRIRCSKLSALPAEALAKAGWKFNHCPLPTPYLTTGISLDPPK
jgi:hypothetical protein